MKLSLEQYKRLLEEKFVPSTDNEVVYVSILVDLIARVVDLEKHTAGISRAAKVIADEVVAIKAAGPAAPEMPADLTAASQGGASGGDSTPFPVGVQTSAPLGTKPDPVVQVADTAPNVKGGGAINPQPIPKKGNANTGASA